MQKVTSEAVTYYTKDSLKNFNIRVELHKVTSSRNPNVLLESLGGLSRTATPALGLGQHHSEQEEWTFKWQQKAFSQHEEELYADINNCLNTIEEQYHREILDLRSKGGRLNTRLFSYVDKDGYKKPVTLENPALTDSESAEKTFASQNEPSVRRRPVSKKQLGLKPRNPVSYKPTNDERLTHRISTSPSQSMFLMADLRRMDGHDASDEHMLCQITVYASGMVVLRPDFNQGKPAYRLENKHKEVFEYRLEHASKPMSLHDKTNQKRLLFELYHQHINYLNLRVGGHFTEPPENDALGVLLLGEIVSAKGFEYDGLYVTANLELPEAWELDTEDYTLCPRSQLPAVTTQVCSTRSEHKFNVAHFSCPLEFPLVCHAPPSSSSSSSPQECLTKWPRILLEVASLDHWDRHRVEGYGYLDLPKAPGSYEVVVNTWRPTGRRVVDRLRRFFVGGTPELADVSYVACPRDFSGTHLSRYGFRTETAGSVLIKLNLAHHSRRLARNPEGQSSEAKYRGFKGSVAAILESYQRAKDRAASVTSAIGQ